MKTGVLKGGDKYKERIIKRFRYVIKECDYVIDGEVFKRPVIVLIHKETKIPVAVTEYADYLLYRKNIEEDVIIWGHSKKGCYAVTNILNYVIIENFDKYHVDDPTQFTREMIQDYLFYFCQKKTKAGFYPTEDSCNDERDSIGTFFYNMCMEREKNPELVQMCHLKSKDLLKVEKYTDGQKRRVEKRWLFQLRYMNNQTGYQQLFRDMPEEVAPRIIAMAEIYDPELTFPLILGLFMGIREGEICNVRRRDSMYGPGILIDYDGRNCRSFKIDLRKEYQLRSDYKSVGHIKRHNERYAFHRYNNTIYKFYKRHLQLISDKPREEYGALFLNKNKCRKKQCYMAMTSDTYRERLEKLMRNHVIPSFKNEINPELRAFYNNVSTHTWGAHALRHWFTVELVLEGLDDVEIMGLRGDKIVTSAQTYLRNKGAIKRKYLESAETLGRIINKVD
ncbi:hypothetical protein SAMN04487830_107102 [Pseudobutyrivibrio sp. OR37]|uniref:site-specific integrase n=1 Tax=Pseudobutyrivibrio sp. OR37 TaxID=1798186 RepID=UPI0008EC0E59|nr:site-specific integrase [Pseudobutyrivibrio sp. OR37]SFH76113.1 hypothetical protein SAMN04487830_107102 [Pseudobutyrivibrio sp. OR37]